MAWLVGLLGPSAHRWLGLTESADPTALALLPGGGRGRGALWNQLVRPSQCRSTQHTEGASAHPARAPRAPRTEADASLTGEMHTFFRQVFCEMLQ